MAFSLSEDRKEFLMLPKLERLAYGFQLHEGAKAKNSKSSFCLCILILSWTSNRGLTGKVGQQQAAAPSQKPIPLFPENLQPPSNDLNHSLGPVSLQLST